MYLLNNKASIFHMSISWRMEEHANIVVHPKYAFEENKTYRQEYGCGHCVDLYRTLVKSA